METVTSFSASLLQSLGGDTEKAADYADKAVTDMADNANKMGTSMESIQNAYQGFAKQNYTMLDNLKLGYGGTKQEMERLITDAEGLDSSFKASRDSNGNLAMSYADIVDAIHIVQDEMGITGTTAKEASETISGSIASMKAAFSNFVTGLADENADVEQLTEDLVDSVGTVVKNLAPVIWQVLKTIGKMALDGIKELGLKAKAKIDEKLEDIKLKVKEKFEEIKEKIISPFREAKEFIREKLEDIKEFFNFDWELPKIKLPHFKIGYSETGGKIWKALGLEGKPKLEVDWYAKAMNNAMLLNSPTIFGMSGGKFLGGGEAGQEVVAGSDTLMGMIRGAVAEQLNNSAIVGLLSEIAQNTGAATTIDINHREFGRLVKGVV